MATQLLHQLGGRRGELDALFPDGVWIQAPRNARAVSEVSAFEMRSRSVLTGQLWEQLELPFHARAGLLLSLCNLAPVAVQNAVTMIHDAQVYLTPQSYSVPFVAWYRFVLPRIGFRHRRILTVSDFSRGQLASFGIASVDRISAIPNGVDHSKGVDTNVGSAAVLELDPGQYCVALANTQVHKNIGLLVRAFSQPALSELRLVLVGAASCQQLASVFGPLPSNVIVPGRLSDVELYSLYGQALCLLMPSRTEGFGLPPLEAMQVGCPAIVAPCGALPEVCGDAALYADPDSPERWIETILSLKCNPALRARLVALGGLRAQVFTWKNAADSLVNTLRECV